MVAPQSIAGSAPPPLLRDVIPRLPQSRRAALLATGRTHRLNRAYGARVWFHGMGSIDRMHVSHAAFGHRSLWRPSTPKQLATAIACLDGRRSGIRADGEILFGDDDAVPWREWMREERRSDEDHSVRVLVKAVSGPRLESPRSLLARLPTCEVASCSAV
jgi:hypothetical protein